MEWSKALLLEMPGGNKKGVKSTSWNSREDKNYYKHKYYWEEGSPAFKAGRERIVSAVCNKIRKEGKFIDRATVRNYVYKLTSAKEQDRPDWYKKITKKARKLGFDPEDKNDQKNITTKDKDGFEGRKYYFSAMMNAYANHFKKQLEGKK
jgi:hypothetical protein